MATTLLTLPAELRNRIFEFIVPPSEEPQGYTLFSEAIQQQPPLLHTCRQLRNELWPMYFSNLKLLVDITNPEIQRFRNFVQAAEERLISTLRRLSITLPCAGYPEFSHEQRCMRAHSVLYDIFLPDTGRFELTESHGWWIRESGKLIFGQMMCRTDSLGYSTCVNWKVLPVNVEDWESRRFQKEELLALIDRLLANQSVAARLGTGNREASSPVRASCIPRENP